MPFRISECRASYVSSDWSQNVVWLELGRHRVVETAVDSQYNLVGTSIYNTVLGGDPCKGKP